MGPPIDDTSLLHGLRAGDVAALRAIYDAWFDALRAFATSLCGSADVAEDVVEDVLVRVWERRRDLAIRSSLRAYLFGAVRQQALLRQRDESNRHRLLRDAMVRGATPGAGSGSMTPEEALEAAALAALLRETVDALPERPREAFLLRRHHGLSHTEIAEAMGIATSTVEKHLARAMSELHGAVARWRAGT